MCACTNRTVKTLCMLFGDTNWQAYMCIRIYRPLLTCSNVVDSCNSASEEREIAANCRLVWDGSSNVFSPTSEVCSLLYTFLSLPCSTSDARNQERQAQKEISSCETPLLSSCPPHTVQLPMTVCPCVCMYVHRYPHPSNQVPLVVSLI